MLTPPLVVIFDFDGTLVDSSAGIYDAFTEASTRVNLYSPAFAEFVSYIGPPIEDIFDQFYPSTALSIKQEFMVVFRREYDTASFKNTSWYEGALRTVFLLKEICGASILIVTNKPTMVTNLILDHSGIRNSFDLVVGCDYRECNGSGDRFINKSSAIIHALECLGATVDRSVYVGDTMSDLKSCKEINMRFIAAQYGYHTWSLSDNAKIESINSIKDLPTFLGYT